MTSITSRTRATPHVGEFAFEAAERIARRLCRDALWSGDRCTWLGWSRKEVTGRVTLTYAPVGGDFYDGTAGIALFLGHIAAATEDRIVRRCVRAALQHAATRIGESQTFSVYSGLCGYALALAELAMRLDDDEFFHRAKTAFEHVAAGAAHEAPWDIISGSAGCILALIRVASHFADARFIDAAVAHGEHLAQLARRQEIGQAWPADVAGAAGPLAGFAHGAAGAVWALTALYRETGDERFLRIAEDAVRYEDSLWESEAGNWRDLRADAGFGESWCYGSVGIGLARLRLTQSGASKYERGVKAAADAAVKGLRSATVSNQCLCHGTAGTLDFLAEAHAHDATLAEPVDEILLRLARQEIQSESFNCGLGEAKEAPGLLVGIAGIGYTLMRHSGKIRAVSVLAIDLPTPKGRYG
jgi:lantibiotic biosynthesis protein